MSKSEIQVLDFEKICRLCLLEKRSMSAIFSKKKSDKKVPLPVRIMSCASLQLYEGDGLPASICNKCLMSVNQSYAFREQCEQADTTLRQYAQRLTEANEEASTNPILVIKEKTEKFEKMESDFESVDMSEYETSNESNDKNWSSQPKNKKSTRSETESSLKKLSLISGISVIRKSPEITIGNTKDVLKQLFGKPTVKKPRKVVPDSATAQFIEEYGIKVDENDPDKCEKIVCKECKISFGRSYFYNHVKFVHKKIRDHLCPDCGYRAHTGRILREHIEHKHSGVVLTCSECSKNFSSGERLRLHTKKFHSGEPVDTRRKVVCQYCGKAFRGASCLTKHFRVHTQETPYQCQFCERKFKNRWACKNHEHLHTGVKPYKCTYCGEAFTQNCVRKSHEYRVHGNEEFNPKNRIPKTGLKREKLAEKSKVEVQAVNFVDFVKEGFKR